MTMPMETETIEYLPGQFVETRNAKTGPEMRVAFEIRAEKDGDDLFIRGYAALFDVRTTLLPWLVEEIAPGAFKKAIEVSDTALAINHNPDLILARMSNKTLEVYEDAKGLHYSGRLQDTAISRHYWQMVDCGNIRQSSFKFTTEKDERTLLNAKQELRRLIEVRSLLDVAPVTDPAYIQTTATTRSKPVPLSPFEDAETRKRFISLFINRNQ